MTDQGTAKPSDELKQLAMRRPHLREHLLKFKQITGEFPMLVDEPGDFEVRRPNLSIRSVARFTVISTVTWARK